MAQEMEALQAFNALLSFLKFSIGVWAFFMLMVGVLHLGRILKALQGLHNDFNKFYNWMYSKENSDRGFSKPE